MWIEIRTRGKIVEIKIIQILTQIVKIMLIMIIMMMMMMMISIIMTERRDKETDIKPRENSYLQFIY